MKRTGKYIIRLLVLCVSVGAIIYLYRSKDLAEQILHAGRLNLRIFMFLLSLQLLTLLMTAYSMRRLLSFNAGHLSFFDVFRATMAASFIEGVTPSSKFGGEAVKCVLLSQMSGISKKRVASVIVLQKIISIVPLVVLSFLLVSMSASLFTVPHKIIVSIRLLFLVMGILSIPGYLIWYRLTRNGNDHNGNDHNGNDHNGNDHNGNGYNGDGYNGDGGFSGGFTGAISIRLTRYAETMRRAIPAGPRCYQLALLVALSFGVWILYPVKLYVVGWVSGDAVPFLLVSVALFAAYCVSMLPLTPGGLGTFEMTLAGVLAVNGYDLSTGLALAVLLRLFTYWLPLLLSLVCWLSFVLFPKGNGFFRNSYAGSARLREQGTQA